MNTLHEVLVGNPGPGVRLGYNPWDTRYICMNRLDMRNPVKNMFTSIHAEWGINKSNLTGVLLWQW